MRPLKDTSTEDMELVWACKRGEKEAFSTLVTKYQDRIFNMMMRFVGDYETAGDLTQEAFLHAYQGLKKFQEASSFFTWLFRIAVNLATSARRKHLRKRKVISFTKFLQNEERDWEPASREDDPGKSMEERERNKYIAEAISSLEEPFRTAIILRDIEGLSYEEVQEILDCPIGTVRSRIHRARLLMKEKLEKYL